MREPKQWYDDSYERIHDLDGERDSEIDRLERTIGANKNLSACMATPGWKAYHAYLVDKFDKLNAKLIYGVDLSEGERFHLQGRLIEIKELVSDREEREKMVAEDRQRLDLLLKERKNLKEQTATTT